MNKKLKKEKLIKRPKLYWFYVTYWIYMCFTGFILCTERLKSLKLLDKDNPIVFHTSNCRYYVLIFFAATILWLITLLWLIWYKKRVFYRKWLSNSLSGFLFIFLFMLFSEVYAYINREEKPELPQHCFHCNEEPEDELGCCRTVYTKEGTPVWSCLDCPKLIEK